jgi:hypothetical protein
LLYLKPVAKTDIHQQIVGGLSIGPDQQIADVKADNGMARGKKLEAAAEIHGEMSLGRKA